MPRSSVDEAQWKDRGPAVTLVAGVQVGLGDGAVAAPPQAAKALMASAAARMATGCQIGFITPSGD